jgi:GTP-binding protein
MADDAPHPAVAPEPGPHLTPADLTEEQLEAGRKLFATECRFFFGAQKLDQLPPPGGTEIAFAGRSNVGKSSLLNALTGRNSLARTSSEPGRTRQLNFFDLGGRLTLVDMPGYGYARASKDIKADWQGMMFEYLRGRPTLTRVMLLLDSRIELKESDLQVMKLLDRAAVTYQIVLTKADGLRPSPLEKKRTEVLTLIRKHPAAFPEIAVTSSETGYGIPELRAILTALVV